MKLKNPSLDYDLLYDLYIVQELSTHDIAKQLNCSAQKVHNNLQLLNIKTRDSRNHTKRSRQKISESHKGENCCFYNKKRPDHSERMKVIMRGRKFSQDTRDKMSKAKKGLTGPRHNKWMHPTKRKGNLYYLIRRLDEMKIWRMSVFLRDKYICQICLKHCSNLQADHINPLCALVEQNGISTIQQAVECKELWNIENGRTLCIPCHKQTDTYGFKARKYLKKYNK